MMQQFGPRGYQVLPPAIKNLLIINGLFFLATIALDEAFHINLVRWLGLPYWTASNFMPHQVVTHLFMHGDIGHIFSNMFSLWMFGSMLENVWGAKRFLIFYFITGFGAALLYQTVNGFEIMAIHQKLNAFTADPNLANLNSVYNSLQGTIVSLKEQNIVNIDATCIGYLRSNSVGSIDANAAQCAHDWFVQLIEVRKNNPAVGASGAVFGVLTAFAMYFPNTELMLIFLPIPIKAKYFVALYALVELYLGVANNPADNVAHFAHLGGALFGFILVKYWNKKNRKTFY